MLIWVCALRCEAKPVIDFYRLKKSAGDKDFDLYRNGNISCVVSGIGEQNMEKAIAWAHELFSAEDQPCWINLGIAGHKSLAVGAAILVSRFKRQNSTADISAKHIIPHSFPLMPVTSLSREQTDYHENTLFDMEAYAFIQSTTRLSPIEQCHSIKVISDNQHTAPTRNKARVSQLIANNLPSITEFATRLTRAHKRTIDLNT